MDMQKMTVAEVIEYLHSDDSFNDFAFRGDDFVTSNYRNSRFHADDGSTIELDGVSAVNMASLDEGDIVDAISKAATYGGNVVLLRGTQINADECTGDPDECLMQDSETVCIVVR